jgi:hypothetical protein
VQNLIGGADDAGCERATEVEPQRISNVVYLGYRDNHDQGEYHSVVGPWVPAPQYLCDACDPSLAATNITRRTCKKLRVDDATRHNIGQQGVSDPLQCFFTSMEYSVLW